MRNKLEFLLTFGSICCSSLLNRALLTFVGSSATFIAQLTFSTEPQCFVGLGDKARIVPNHYQMAASVQEGVLTLCIISPGTEEIDHCGHKLQFLISFHVGSIMVSFVNFSCWFVDIIQDHTLLNRKQKTMNFHRFF